MILIDLITMTFLSQYFDILSHNCHCISYFDFYLINMTF